MHRLNSNESIIKVGSLAREIPVDEGNRAEISVTLLHQNFIGVDEFLGRIALALVDFDVYESPKTRHNQRLQRPISAEINFKSL